LATERGERTDVSKAVRYGTADLGEKLHALRCCANKSKVFSP
jgi:hypothetical protein